MGDAHPSWRYAPPPIPPYPSHNLYKIEGARTSSVGKPTPSPKGEGKRAIDDRPYDARSGGATRAVDDLIWIYKTISGADGYFPCRIFVFY
jgi:hypothetical protein